MRIGIIGCGRVLPAHLAGISQVLEAGVCEATITALCSGHVENALMFRSPQDGVTPRQPPTSDPGNPMSTPHVYVSQLQAHRPEVFDDYRAMLDADLVDAVLILTQVWQHHDMARDCFGAGVHALVEKPLAVTTQAAQIMIESAAAHDRVLAVAEMVRHIELHRAQRWAVENGRIGRIQFVAHREMGAPGRPPHLGSGNLWRHQLNRVGSNTAVDLGVHRLHMIEYVAGRIESVSGMTGTLEEIKSAPDRHADYTRVRDESDDFCISQLRLAGGGFGQVLIARGLHGQPLDQPHVTAYYGSSGSIVGRRIADDRGDSADVVDLLRREADQSLLDRWFPAGVKHEFGLQFADFLAAIQNGEAPECDGRQGLRDLALAYAQLESGRLLREVSPEEVIDRRAYAWQGPIDAALGMDRD